MGAVIILKVIFCVTTTDLIQIKTKGIFIQALAEAGHLKAMMISRRSHRSTVQNSGRLILQIIRKEKRKKANSAPSETF